MVFGRGFKRQAAFTALVAAACHRAPRAAAADPDAAVPLGYFTPDCVVRGGAQYDVALRVGSGHDTAAAARGEGALVVRLRRLREGDALADAQVRLLTLDGGRLLAGIQDTAGTGYFTLARAPAGDHTLDVRRIGYHFSGRVRVNPGGADTLTIWLNPAGAKSGDIGCDYRRRH